MSWFSSWWNNEPARDAAERQSEASAATLAADQAANKQNLDFQKVLAYIQSQSANQSNAQQLAATLSGQQAGYNQYAQLYNQDMANRLPQQMTQLAGLQAMTPLMQMAGMTGYQMPTSVDTTKLQAPDVIGDFNKLSQYYQGVGQQQLDAPGMLEAFSNPEAFLAQYAPPAAASSNLVDVVTGLPVAAPATTPPAGGTVSYPTLPGLSTNQPAQAYTSLQAAPMSQAAQVTETPAYKWEQQQINKAMMNQLAAQGLTGSGAATKMSGDAAMQLSQSEYDRQFQRLKDLVSIGQGYQPQATGQAAGAQLASMYSQGSQNTAGALQNAANARSSAYSGLGNAYSNYAGANANSLGQYYGATGAAQANKAMSSGGQFGKILDLGATIYGMGSSGGGSQGYFGSPGAWSNPTSTWKF